MPNNWYDMVYLDDIPVNRYFSQICRHVLGEYQFHFFLNQILPLSHRIWFAPSAFCHSCVCRSFCIEGWGHFPTSNFARQNTEVGTHFLCLLWKFYPLLSTTTENPICQKRVKKNPVIPLYLFVFSIILTIMCLLFIMCMYLHHTKRKGRGVCENTNLKYFWHSLIPTNKRPD